VSQVDTSQFFAQLHPVSRKSARNVREILEGEMWEADQSVPGLGIMTLKSGTRTWYLRYREQGGKQRTSKIGRADVLNRAAARREALKILSEVAQGRAPRAKRDQARAGLTMAGLLPLMEQRHYVNLGKTTAAAYKKMWQNRILPRLGKKRVTEIERRDVLDMLDGLPPIMHNRVLQCVRAAFHKAALWQLRPEGTNPCGGVEKLAERIRKRYLSDEERQRLLAALDTIATTPLRWRFAQLVKLLLLTGCRVGEICRGRWEWFDEKAGVLVIPAERHKTGKKTGEERVVHVPPAAILILRELRLKSHSPWIIAGQGDGHLVGYQKLWLELMAAAKIKNFRVHDARHNFASVAITKAGLTLAQVGGLLGHASPVTTSRYAHLVDQGAKDMAESVADQLGM
jgi:integrase